MSSEAIATMLVGMSLIWGGLALSSAYAVIMSRRRNSAAPAREEPPQG